MDKKKVVIIVIVILLIIVIGVVAYTMSSSTPAPAVSTAQRPVEVAPVNPCAQYTDDSSNISRECILHMWKNIAGCPNSMTPSMLSYYEQVTKPSTAPVVTIDGRPVSGGSQTLGRMTNDARLWASLSTMMHREGCYGTDMSKWPKNLLRNDAEYIAYTDKVKDWVYTNVKAIGAFVKINPGVLDTERAGIIMGNFPNEFSAGGNSQLGVEIHTERRARIYINGGYIDWKPEEPIPLNTWTHIAFVLKDDRIEYYRDGVLKQTVMGTPEKPTPVLARVPNIKVGYDNRANSLQQVPNKLQVSNLLISQGGNSMAWTSSFVNELFTKYKPVESFSFTNLPQYLRHLQNKNYLL